MRKNWIPDNRYRMPDARSSIENRNYFFAVCPLVHRAYNVNWKLKNTPNLRASGLSGLS